LAEVTRIGGGGGFWGDQTMAPVNLLEQSELDYLTMDYLAEVTMSIMHKQLERDAEAGWASDLKTWLEVGGIDLLYKKKVRLVTNAGGANPRACASMVLSAASAIGWNDCKVGIVIGDDLTNRLTGIAATGEKFTHMFDEGLGSLLDYADNVVSANAYLGAGGVARCLERGADIVITGRTADASLIVGCMLHSCGWSKNAEENGLNICGPIETWYDGDTEVALDIIAGWTVAGHLIECGAQVSGGNSSDWKMIGDLENLGYPIAEVSGDGTCIITKPAGTQGSVTKRTVSEQLLYEIGDPSSYHTPDCTVDITSVTLEDIALDRVEVKGAKGRRPPETLKISATHRDGWFAAAELAVPGPDCIRKAKHLDETLRNRLAHLRDMEIHSEFLGHGFLKPPGLRQENHEPSEVIIRWAATSNSKKSLQEFGRSIAPLVLTGPAGICGYGARPRPREQLRFFPTTVNRVLIEPQVHLKIMHSWRHELEIRMPWIDERFFDKLESMARVERGVKAKIAGHVLRKLEGVKISDAHHK